MEIKDGMIKYNIGDVGPYDGMVKEKKEQFIVSDTGDHILDLAPGFISRDPHGGGIYNETRAKMIRGKDEIVDVWPEHPNSRWYKLSTHFPKMTKNSKNTLDIGCGTGRFFTYLHSENIYGLDGSLEMLGYATNHHGKKNYKNLRLIRDDMTKFVDRSEYHNKFDYIFSIHVIGNCQVFDRKEHPNAFFEFLEKIPKLSTKNGIIEFNIDGGEYKREELSSKLEELASKNLISKNYNVSKPGEGLVNPPELKAIWLNMEAI